MINYLSGCIKNDQFNCTKSDQFSAAVMRRRIDFLRHSLFWVCGIVRRRNGNAHIAGDKCGSFAAYLVRHNYISIDIYTDPYKGSPNIYETYKRKSSEKRKFQKV